MHRKHRRQSGQARQYKSVGSGVRLGFLGCGPELNTSERTLLVSDYSCDVFSEMLSLM